MKVDGLVKCVEAAEGAEGAGRPLKTVYFTSRQLILTLMTGPKNHQMLGGALRPPKSKFAILTNSTVLNDQK